MGIVNWEKLSRAPNGYFANYHSTGTWVVILLLDFLRQERLSWLENITSSFTALLPVPRDTCYTNKCKIAIYHIFCYWSTTYFTKMPSCLGCKNEKRDLAFTLQEEISQRSTEHHLVCTWCETQANRTKIYLGTKLQCHLVCKCFALGRNSSWVWTVMNGAGFFVWQQ